MKNVLLIIGAAAALAIAAYFITRDAGEREAPRAETAIFQSSELGLEFTYPTGQGGYVLNEMAGADARDLKKVLLLIRSEDASREPPEGGEGPPVIVISVFGNPNKQWPAVWADNNIQHSNIDLAMGAVSEAVVGGANAIRYRADGLYASDNVVVAHGENVYVITGQFIDENSAIHRDFEPLVQSIRFLPQPGQE